MSKAKRPTRKQLDKKIDEFLAERRKSDGGYPEVTDKDLEQLYDIVQGLADLKAERDCDNDQGIEFLIYSRREHERLHYAAVPYDRNRGEWVSPESFARHLDIVNMNYSIASDSHEPRLAHAPVLLRPSPQEEGQGAVKPVILYRPNMTSAFGEDEGELEAMQKHFHVLRQRGQIQPNQLVIGRYSVLPFYKELEEDVRLMGGQMINSYQQHRWIADLGSWATDLAMYTPGFWTRLEDLPRGGGPYVLKGETNSKKDQWHTHMYAENNQAAVNVWLRLKEDSLIASQQIYIRPFVPLVTLAWGMNQEPITKEFRFFVLDGKILSGAFYWSSHVGDLEHLGVPVPKVEEVPQDFLQEVIGRIKDKARFVVIDVAQLADPHADGRWTVIELNDGQMSGLSENDPDTLYKNLAAALK